MIVSGAEARAVPVRRLGSQDHTVMPLSDAIAAFAKEATVPG